MNAETYTLGKQIIEAIQNKKVVKLEALDVSHLTPLAECFIIAIGSNVKQTKALADEVEKCLEVSGVLPTHKEGYQTSNWILLDYGEIIVHILDEEHAQFYGLSRLWQDASLIEL